MKRRLTNTTVFDGYTTAGGWNVMPDFAPPIITEPVGDKAIRYWQDLACANRKVAEDNQTKLAAAQTEIARLTKRKDECSNGWDEAMAQRDKVRDDALEQAAKVCETHQDDRNRHNYTKDAYIATLQCAAAIRAMKAEK